MKDRGEIYVLQDLATLAATLLNTGSTEAVSVASHPLAMIRTAFEPATAPAETASAQPEWDGEGLPPAGTLCELRNVAAGTEWSEATIMFASRNVVVWDWVGEPSINGLCTAYAHAVEMRPVRTPEQIAAEERKRIEEEIQRICTDGENNGVPFFVALYDAGYRKQVAPSIEVIEALEKVLCLDGTLKQHGLLEEVEAALAKVKQVAP